MGKVPGRYWTEPQETGRKHSVHWVLSLGKAVLCYMSSSSDRPRTSVPLRSFQRLWSESGLLGPPAFPCEQCPLCFRVMPGSGTVDAVSFFLFFSKAVAHLCTKASLPQQHPILWGNSCYFFCFVQELRREVCQAPLVSRLSDVIPRLSACILF